MSMTVREMVQACQVEIRDTDLHPARASQLLATLTALIGNCNAEIRIADADYASTLLDCMATEGKANRARIVAETTPAYRRKCEARDTKELVIELVRSLKYVLRAAEEEMRLGSR
jgi:hypothetical protein